MPPLELRHLLVGLSSVDTISTHKPSRRVGEKLSGGYCREEYAWDSVLKDPVRCPLKSLVVCPRSRTAILSISAHSGECFALLLQKVFYPRFSNDKPSIFNGLLALCTRFSRRASLWRGKLEMALIPTLSFTSVFTLKA